MERIYLLSMGFGSGHNETAKVLHQAYHEQTGVTAEFVDLLKLIPKTFHPLLQNGYHGMLNRFPLFYHCLYGWTHQSKVIRYVSGEFIEKLGWTIRKKMNDLLETFDPTMIVTTHPFGLLLIPPQWHHVPSLGVVTDYELHPMWLARVPDVLCLPKHILSSFQYQRVQWNTGTKIVETGIPVRAEFYQEIIKSSARSQLRLPVDRPVVLVMGGGAGLGPLEDLVAELKPLTHIQFVIMTGKNVELYHHLQTKYQSPHIRIESYRRDIPLWMSAADLLVTKPGGISISEAIAKRLPMFLFEAFPGQEEANQEYMTRQGVAVITKPDTIRLQINHFFAVDTHRKKMKRRFNRLLTPFATQQVIEETMNRSELFHIL